MSLIEQAKAQYAATADAERTERSAQEKIAAKARADKLADELGQPVVWKRTSVVELPSASGGRWYPVKVYGMREFLVADEVRIAYGTPPRSASSMHKTCWLITGCVECDGDAYAEFPFTPSERSFVEELGKVASKPTLCTTCKLLAEDARCSHCGQPYGMEL